VQNKAFFFGNFDAGRKTTPTGYSLDGASGQPWLHTAEVQEILDIATNRYGYDAGGLGEVSTPQENNKYFLRTDYNLGTKHQLTARVNYIDASRQLTTSGIPRLVSDESAARAIIGQIVEQNARFGLPALGIRQDGARGIITVHP